MKRVISIIIAAVLAVGFSNASFARVHKRTQKEIILTQTKNIDKINRDLFTFAEASYYPDMNMVEIACYEMKQTSVYILSPGGEVVACDSFDSSENPFCVLDVPETAGKYILVIDSHVYYAEGEIIVE